MAEFRDGADQTVKTGVKKGTVDDASKKPQAQKQAMTMKIEKKYFENPHELVFGTKLKKDTINLLDKEEFPDLGGGPLPQQR